MKFIEKYPIIMIVVGVIGISLSSIFVKYSLSPSSVTAAFRLLWTVVLMTPVVLSKRAVRKEIRHSNKKTFLLSILSGVFLAIHFVLWFESLTKTSVASSTSIVCTEVIWVALGFALFLKGKITKNAVLAIFVTLIGSVMIAFSSPEDEAHITGVVLALMAAVAVAVYMLLGRVVRETTSTTVYTYIVYVACSLTLIIMCLVQRLNMFSYGISPVIVGFLLSVFSTILGHSIFSWCLKYFSPSFVSASKLLEPVVASVIALFLFKEIPSYLQIAGSVLILGGVYYYSIIETKSTSDYAQCS